MVNQDKCTYALLFASIKHGKQKMIFPNVPYVTHLQGVFMEALMGCINSKADVDLEYISVLALLHDVLEDTDTTYDEIELFFDKQVAEGVKALTKDENLPKEEQMIDCIRRIKCQKKEVAIVKLADRIFNLREIPSVWDDDKVNNYRNESMLLLNELGSCNVYFKERLESKINKYIRGASR